MGLSYSLVFPAVKGSNQPYIQHPCFPPTPPTFLAAPQPSGLVHPTTISSLDSRLRPCMSSWPACPDLHGCDGMPQSLCVLPAARLCCGPHKSFPLSQHCFYRAELSLGISCPAIQSYPAHQSSRRPLWVPQKLFCGLTSKYWHSSRDAAELIILVPPHL